MSTARWTMESHQEEARTAGHLQPDLEMTSDKDCPKVQAQRRQAMCIVCGVWICTDQTTIKNDVKRYDDDEDDDDK